MGECKDTSGFENCKSGDTVTCIKVIKGVNDDFLTLGKDYVVKRYHTCGSIVEFIGDDNHLKSVHSSKFKLK